jgi:hypothetical protein
LTADSADDIDRSNTMKKKEKEMSEAEQQTYKEEDMQGQSYKLSKGAESEREKSTKRPPTGA